MPIAPMICCIGKARETAARAFSEIRATNMESTMLYRAWMKKDIIIGTAMDISSGRTAIVPMRFCCSLRFSVIYSSLTALF